MTTAQAQTIVSSSSRCTQAAVRALGVKCDFIPHFGSGTLQVLINAGKVCLSVHHASGHTLAYCKKNLIADNSNYLVFTKSHAMAVVKGVLVDTMRESFNSRRVLHMWEVV